MIGRFLAPTWTPGPTDDPEMMNLRDPVEGTFDADSLRETIGLAADELMELKVGAATGEACLPSDEAIVVDAPICAFTRRR